MREMLRKLTFFCCLILPAVCGCASSAQKSEVNYETVTANPRRDPEAAKLLNRDGALALSKGKYDKAEKLFKDALAKDVDCGPAHNNLGRLYFDQGKNYLAAWEFEYAIKVMPKRGEPYNNLGMVMEKVGKMEQAIEAYETANVLCPNNPEVVGNLARVWWCNDKSNLRTREILEHLVFVDSRPDWVLWAKEQIACGKLASNEVHPVSYNAQQNTAPMPIPVQAPHLQYFPTPTLAPPVQSLPKQ